MRYSTLSARYAATRPTRWITGWRSRWHMRWAQMQCCGHSRRTPALAVPRLPQAQDRAGQATGEVPVSLLAGLAQRAKNAASAPRVAAVVSAALQSGTGSAAQGFSCRVATQRRRVKQTVVRRIQRSRQPTNTRYCGRPTEWGNPFPIDEEYTRTEALEAFRAPFWAHELPVTPARARTELAA